MSSSRTRLLAFGKKTTAYCSLFLQVLRCFSSLGALSDIHLSQLGLPEGVSPFGHFRITGCLAPPRNLSQLGHVLHRLCGAKASSVCSSSFLIAYRKLETAYLCFGCTCIFMHVTLLFVILLSHIRLCMSFTLAGRKTLPHCYAWRTNRTGFNFQ